MSILSLDEITTYHTEVAMKEQLYTIPVNDAFDLDCECPLCSMYQNLEQDAIEFTMGDSYMEDDVRMETNAIGFCDVHLKKLYEFPNRLGLALVLQTHMDEVMKNIEKLCKEEVSSSGSFFKKKQTSSPLTTYIHTTHDSCYICNRIERMFSRYIATIFRLYKNDTNFRKKFVASKGFCVKHYAVLYEESKKQLSPNLKTEFMNTLNQLMLENMKRVREDLEWFTNKFDYRYANEPWKNAKDALLRSLLKINGIYDLIE